MHLRRLHPRFQRSRWLIRHPNVAILPRGHTTAPLKRTQEREARLVLDERMDRVRSQRDQLCVSRRFCRDFLFSGQDASHGGGDELFQRDCGRGVVGYLGVLVLPERGV